VGIGASAGGLEAFTQLLSALTPQTRMAFVLVQHLAPLHKSMLTQILSNETRIPVQEVKDGMRVEPNNVYVIPPNASLGIFHGVLHLMPRGEGARHLPIDSFFKSLAEDQKGRAIGVILAGTASDGSMGLRAIKAEGGITLAQDPSTAKYDGMPRAAIAAGVVDFVLPPDKLALELAKIGEHPYVKAAKSPQPDVMEPEDQLHKVFFILRTHSGVDFIHYKHATLRRRIKRRMVLRKLDSLTDYVRYLEGHPQEVDELYQDILIHVTSFFRDPDLFEHLKLAVYSPLLKGRTADSPIRIWVPGCSTGEEAYSLAMSLLEHIDAGKWRNVRIQIFASDISQQAIDKARVGFYTTSIEADVSTERLRKYFSKSDGGYRVSKKIRDLCVFARQDMTKDPPFSKIDLITCRNVLIYLGAALQKRVISIFHYALKPSAFLVLGASETIGAHSDLFALADKTHKIYRKKSALMRLNMEFPLDYSERLDPQRRLPPAARSRSELSTEVDRIILDRFAPAGVVVNGDFQIVQFRGHTGSYLEPAPGTASLSVLKMARDGLAIELRSALQTSRRKNTTERRERVCVKRPGGMGEVNVEVIPLTSEETEKHFVILFWDAAPPPATKSKRKGSDDDKDMGRLGKLEQELTATREYLQSIIQDQEATNEELQSANEEILSSNEELQSTNEELETAKEELQSANEELNTVNDELQTRNQELGQTNSDLTNLLASVQIPIVIVGNDLRVRRLTPMAEKIFNLIPGDVGRPIGDIKHNHLQLDDLESLIRDAIDSISLREKEVRDASGHWYSLRIRPYKNVENRIDGAVLALVDIHRAKGIGADGGEAVSSKS
jgi:two-component system, chemotaxis family, CheB/CheR fusion protein